MLLHELKPPRWSKKRKKIVGRGPGSGHGKTSCKGHKGQTSRSGRGILRTSEGGQMPLIKRLGKVGFRPKRQNIFQLVNLKSLTRFKEGTVINGEFLKSHGLIKDVDQRFKILGDGELQKPLEIHAHQFSESAKEKIVKAGGKAELIKAE
jgi:large subunit ribosomal protein L15